MLNLNQDNVKIKFTKTHVKFESEYLWSRLMNLTEQIEISPVKRDINLIIDINLDPIS